MITNRVKKLLQKYGKTNGRDLIWRYIYVIGAWIIIVCSTWYFLPLPLKIYLVVITLVLVCYCIVMYFFMKKENSEKNSTIKKIAGFIVEIVFGVTFFPFLFLEYLINNFAEAINKEYLLKRNSHCFLMEVAFHLLFVAAIFVAMGMYVNDTISLIAICFTLFLVDKGIAYVIRHLLINGESKCYERYRYNKEMNAIVEYFFLFASVIAVFLQTSHYEKIFVPILLWYSIKQVHTYYNQQRISRLDRKYMIEIMAELEEINEVYLENFDGKLDISVNIDSRRLQIYQNHISKKAIVFYFSKKKMNATIDVIHRVLVQEYILPRDIEKARQDIFVVLNKIVKCI